MIFKAHAVKKTGKQVAKTHNLKYLNKLAELKLEGDELELILDANGFNMEARYPSEKLKFYKLCNKKYTDQYFDRILSLHKKLCQKMRLWRLTVDADPRIEPILLEEIDLTESEASIMGEEVRRHGILVV